jgi:protein SCO1/2
MTGSIRTAAVAALAAAMLATPAAASRTAAERFPNVPLVTQDGKTVRFYDDLIKGKPAVAINVIFTECTEVCPLETANLAALSRALGERFGRDIQFYSISIDPKRDTPRVLKEYAAKFDAKWLFLTGRPEDIQLLTKRIGLVRSRDAAASSHHAAQLLVGSEATNQWSRHSAVDNPEFLAARMGTFLGWRDSAPQRSYAEARPLSVDDGQRLFQSRCSACHSIGKGDAIGPDLAGVSARRERAWLTRYVQAPDAMLAAGDPVATGLFQKYRQVRMPNLKLSTSEAGAIVSYLATPAVASAGKPHPHGAAHRH